MIQVFKFMVSAKTSAFSNDSFDLSSIVCKLLQNDISIPSSGVLCPLELNTKVKGRDKFDYLTVFSHFGGGNIELINMKTISI